MYIYVINTICVYLSNSNLFEMELNESFLTSIFTDGKRNRNKYDFLFIYLQQQGVDVKALRNNPSVIYRYIRLLLPKISNHISKDDLRQPLHRIFSSKEPESPSDKFTTGLNQRGESILSQLPKKQHDDSSDLNNIL